MDWFAFVLLAFATYRVTRFTQLDSMFEDTRDIVVHWLTERRRDAVGLRRLVYRKAADGLTCAFCVSFWVGVGWLGFWAAISDYTLDWPILLHAFALAGAAMLVYRIVDPPEHTL